MTIPKKTLLIGFSVALLLTVSGVAHARDVGAIMQFTFRSPVEIPGIVLPAGTYTFEAVNGSGLTRVLDANGGPVRAFIQTVPIDRSEGKEGRSDETITLEKNPVPGSVERIRAWYFPDDSSGWEFIYKDDRSGHSATLRKEVHQVDHAALESAEFAGKSAEFLPLHTGKLAEDAGRDVGRGVRAIF